MQVGAAAWFVRILWPHTRRSPPSWARYRPMLVAGGHLAVRSLAMYAVWTSSTFVAAHIDTPTLAANLVLVQLFNALALALDALAIPAQSLVARARGNGDVGAAVRVGHSSTRLSLWCGGALAVVLAATSPIVPHLFTDDPAVQQRMTAGLIVLAVMQLPGAVAFALDGALIGAHDERFLGRAGSSTCPATSPGGAHLGRPRPRHRRTVAGPAHLDDDARHGQRPALAVSPLDRPPPRPDPALAVDRRLSPSFVSRQHAETSVSGATSTNGRHGSRGMEASRAGVRRTVDGPSPEPAAWWRTHAVAAGEPSTPSTRSGSSVVHVSTGTPGSHRRPDRAPPRSPWPDWRSAPWVRGGGQLPATHRRGQPAEVEARGTFHRRSAKRTGRSAHRQRPGSIKPVVTSGGPSTSSPTAWIKP